MKLKELGSIVFGAALLWATIFLIGTVATRLGCSEVSFTGISTIESEREWPQ